MSGPQHWPEPFRLGVLATFPRERRPGPPRHCGDSRFTGSEARGPTGQDAAGRCGCGGHHSRHRRRKALQACLSWAGAPHHGEARGPVGGGWPAPGSRGLKQAPGPVPQPARRRPDPRAKRRAPALSPAGPPTCTRGALSQEGGGRPSQEVPNLLLTQPHCPGRTGRAHRRPEAQPGLRRTARARTH